MPRFQQPNFDRDYRTRQFFLFVQDTFKLSSRLVLNLGLRYENFGSPSNTGEMKDAIVELGQGASFPERLQSESTALSFPPAGDQQLYNRDNNDLALRLGFSYDLFGDSRTVVRGAYGIFHDRPFDNLWQNLRNNNFVLGTFPYRPSADPDGYLAEVSSVLPAYEGSTFSMDFPGLTLFDPNLRTGYAQNFFAGVQREVTDSWNIELNLLGALGRKLITTDIVNRQFSLPLDETTGGRLNPALPDISYRAGQGSSSYYAFTAVSRYRTRRALFQLSYTWGHTIDNQSDPLLGDFFDLSFAGAASAGSPGSRASFARQFDSGADRGNADFDQRHNLVFYSIWDLPRPCRLQQSGCAVPQLEVRSDRGLSHGFPLHRVCRLEGFWRRRANHQSACRYRRSRPNGNRSGYGDSRRRAFVESGRGRRIHAAGRERSGQ